MDPKVLYWTGALLNFAGVVVCAVVGVRRIRRGEIAGHRRMMLTSASLVALFLASYVVKVFALGRENLAVWDRFSLTSLHVHETCVLVMLLAGGYAGVRAWRFGRPLPERKPLPPGSATAAARRAHRRAGWVAVLSSALGLVMATFVLIGMYARL